MQTQDYKKLLHFGSPSNLKFVYLDHYTILQNIVSLDEQIFKKRKLSNLTKS